MPSLNSKAEEEASEFGEVEQIVVTGSRVRRDTFSSPSPIQVLDVTENRKLGVTTIGEMLQRSTVAVSIFRVDWCANL